MIVLQRFGHKGQFVKYPKKWEPRMPHTGKRRFQTYCDLIMGVCACGDRHTGSEGWIQELLEMYNMRIETHSEWLERQRQS